MLISKTHLCERSNLLLEVGDAPGVVARNLEGGDRSRILLLRLPDSVVEISVGVCHFDSMFFGKLFKLGLLFCKRWGHMD